MINEILVQIWLNIFVKISLIFYEAWYFFVYKCNSSFQDYSTQQIKYKEPGKTSEGVILKKNTKKGSKNNEGKGENIFHGKLLIQDSRYFSLILSFEWIFIFSRSAADICCINGHAVVVVSYILSLQIISLF